MKPQLRPPCSPDLTNFRHSSPCRTEQQRSWPSKRTTNNRSTNMLTAVVVDSQMANCNGFGLSASNPTFSNHCKHLKKYSSCRPKKEKKLSSGLAKSIPSQFKSVKTDTSMAWIKKSRSSLQQKAYWTRTVSRGQPFRNYSNV